MKKILFASLRRSWIAIINWTLLLGLVSCSYFVVHKELQSLQSTLLYVVKLLITAVSYLYLEYTLIKINYQKKYSQADMILPWAFFRGLETNLLEKHLSSSLEIIKYKYGKTIPIHCEIDGEVDLLAYLSKKPRFGSDFKQHHVITIHPRLVFILNSERLLGFVILHEYAHYIHKDFLRKKMFKFLLITLVAAQPLLFLPLFAFGNLSNRLCEYAADYFATSHCGKSNTIKALQKIYETSIVRPEDETTTKLSIKEKLIHTILATHPTIQKRIKFIATL
jgi:Zn-dependent protease with chaperone function